MEEEKQMGEYHMERTPAGTEAGQTRLYWGRQKKAMRRRVGRGHS